MGDIKSDILDEEEEDIFFLSELTNYVAEKYHYDPSTV